MSGKHIRPAPGRPRPFRNNGNGHNAPDPKVLAASRRELQDGFRRFRRDWSDHPVILMDPEGTFGHLPVQLTKAAKAEAFDWIAPITPEQIPLFGIQPGMQAN